MPTKRHSNLNFIISLRNIILNYETKSDKIIRKDYVTKSLIEYTKSLENKDFIWLTYEKFKIIEKKIIEKENKNINADVVKDLIESINNLNIFENNEISKNNENLHMINMEQDLENDFIDIENGEVNNSEESENIENEKSDVNNIDNYNNMELYDRLLKDNRFAKYGKYIHELKKEKKQNKRLHLGDSDELKEIALKALEKYKKEKIE